MPRNLRRLVLGLAVALTLLLGSCGGDNDDPLLASFTGDCSQGPLAFWDCNMTWDQECWQ